VERRLTAVLAADVAGYSRLMGRDEEGTLAGLKSLRRTVVDPAIAMHRGRIVKTTGDGMLVEFASAVDAARCAVEIQRGVDGQNADVPQESRIEFRIGIHVGDIIIDDNDIFGDGVNIAARLEGIAEPGGVCISDDAQRQIRGKVEFGLGDMGQQALKNIAEPMRAWRVHVGDQAASAMPVNPAGLSTVLALPDQPSIAVLPFQNMSGDPEQEYFADGIVEDIITGLSRCKWLFVIARNSTFTYRGKSVDIKQVGRELGVRYVLEGSVRKVGDRVRITAQFIDATTGNHIWADRFDTRIEDIFELQDNVTARVIGAIAPLLERAEWVRSQRKPAESLHAYDYYLRALSASYRLTREANIEMFRYARTAIDIDPEFAAAYSLAAVCLVQRKAMGWRADAAQETIEAGRFARRAIELDKDDPSVLARSGHTIAYMLGELEEGIAALSRAISLDPNHAFARYWSGWVHLYMGDADAAIAQFEVGLRLSPLDPSNFIALNGIATVHFLAGRYKDGLSLATKSMRQRPNVPAVYRTVMACHAMLGRVREAQQACALALQLDPTQRISDIKDRMPFRRTEDIEKFAEAFRIAGMPE